MELDLHRCVRNKHEREMVSGRVYGMEWIVLVRPNAYLHIQEARGSSSVPRVVIPGEAVGWSAPGTEETGMWSRNDLSASLQHSPAASAPLSRLAVASLAASLAISPAISALPDSGCGASATDRSLSFSPCSFSDSASFCSFASREVAGTRLRVRRDRWRIQDTCCVWICPVVVLRFRFWLHISSTSSSSKVTACADVRIFSGLYNLDLDFK